MNKFIKIMLLSACLIAILGIVLIGIGAFTGAKLGLNLRGEGIELASNEKIKDSNLKLEEFSTIEVDLGYSDIIIEEGSDFGIEMVYFDSKYIPEYKIQSGVLYITDNSNKEGAYNFINLDLSLEFEKNTIKIFVPKSKTLADMDITIDSGKIIIQDVMFENIKTSNGLGTTTLNLYGENKDYSLDLDTFAGVVNIDKKLKVFDYKNKNTDSIYTIETQNSYGIVKVKFNN